MPGVFTGIASTLVSGLGQTIRVTPLVGSPFTVRGIFRENVRQIPDELDRLHQVSFKTLRIPRNTEGASQIERGSVIQVDLERYRGKAFKVLDRYMSESPGDDAFIVFPCEEVLP